MKKYCFISIFLALMSLSALAQYAEKKVIRLALPYAQASFELVPLYWALQRQRFKNVDLELKLIYTGSSRAAIETILGKESDIALSDAAIFIIHAAQLQPLNAFLQYQQLNPYTHVAAAGDRKNYFYLSEEDIIPTVIILQNQALSTDDGVVLLKEQGRFWSLFPDCSEQPYFIDRKNTFKAPPNCLASPPTPFLMRKLDFLSQRKTFNTFETPFPPRVRELPGTLFLLNSEELVTKRSLFQRFSRVVIAEMRETFLLPEQISERGLWPFHKNDISEQRLLEIAETLAQSFYRHQPRLEFGQLYAQRYQNLIETMEKLQLIIPGLASNNILIEPSFLSSAQ